MRFAKNVEELKKLDARDLYDGEAVFVEGYYRPGDGGDKTVFFEKDSKKADDGGMVHAAGGGAFVVKSEVADFKYYGIFGADKNADDALDAICANAQVKKVKTSTPLNFARRHKIKRSGICFDFNFQKVTTAGCENAGHDDPFAATFGFFGELTDRCQTLTLQEPLQEFNDIFEVADSAFFEVGGWYIVKCDKLAGSSEYMIDKLIECTEIIDRTHIRLGYKMGWGLEKGRTLSYTLCRPIRDIKFSNMKFYATAGDMYTGTHPFAFEYAVDTEIENIYSQDNFWPLCIRRHNTRFSVRACELVNPCEVIVGGTGYLAQNINCLYGSVRDCRTSNARHLNDFTGSAFCQVENCHGDGDWCGSFVTHGQYEHDLSYVGNSGLLSFANSGFPWGHSAKRITVVRHSGSRIIALAKVSDITFIDCQAYKRQEAADYRNEAFEKDSGTFFVNCDGLRMSGCTAEGGIKFINSSRRSSRRNVIEGCVFNQGPDCTFRISEDAPEVDRIEFSNCDFYGCSLDSITGIKEKSFERTVFHSEE